MAREVVVTRRGQTTIPTEVRKRLGIREGTRLRVEVVDDKVVFTKVPSIFDLAGTSEMSREEAFRRLDAMREEEE
jgi:AbrB family looped-hinge helix DNA binding protein